MSGECGADLEDTLPGQGITCTRGAHDGDRHSHDDPETGTHISWTATKATNREKVNR